ncbi:hypothetical protein PAPYR_11893 [Paratrimastix pyriformis]|uniref:Uncharacterized protein n=1 Tax=Paratrimastix pyriformis TaxID=342808 RepID=A0ABQ8U8D4_9EUKA|nr:hypothetical protein PAPYR_11893 [Paratrimastix pyriformis]
MNSIDWNQFHTPKKPLSTRVRSARTPEMGRGLPGDQLVSRPAATHTAPGAPPAPTPTAPKAPTALTARNWSRANLDDDDVPSPPKPKSGPGGRQAQEGSRGPEEGKKAAPVAAKSKKEAARRRRPRPRPPPPTRRKPGPPHEAKEAAEAKARTTPQEDARPRHRHKHPAPVEISSSSSDEGGRAPEPAKGPQGPADRPDDFSPEAARQYCRARFSLCRKSATAEGPCAAELHRPRPSLARPLAYESASEQL